MGVVGTVGVVGTGTWVLRDSVGSYVPLLRLLPVEDSMGSGLFSIFRQVYDPVDSLHNGIHITFKR